MSYRKTKLIPLILYAILLIVISCAIAAITVLIDKDAYPSTYIILSNLWPAIIFTGLSGLIYSEISKHYHEKQLKSIIDNERCGFQKIYDSTENPDFINLIENLIPKSKTIVLYSAGLNMFWKPRIKGLFVNQIKNKDCNIKVMMANPLSENSSFSLRLEEEKECSYYSMCPKESIIDLQKKLIELEDPSSSFKILLFDHYPTMAILRFDDHLFIYHYGHKTIGTKSPVIYLKDHKSAQTKYYIQQLEKVEKSCI